MPDVNVGVFTLKYALFTNAAPGNDIQFGMDFTVTSTTGKALTQLIFPATAVGTNKAGVWNLDNHRDPKEGVLSVVFSGADQGTITDKPREIVGHAGNRCSTKFAIYIVDVQNATVQSQGIAFGYSVNPHDATPQTAFDGASASTMTNEQKAAITAKFKNMKFK